MYAYTVNTWIRKALKCKTSARTAYLAYYANTRAQKVAKPRVVRSARHRPAYKIAYNYSPSQPSAIRGSTAMELIWSDAEKGDLNEDDDVVYLEDADISPNFRRNFTDAREVHVIVR